MAEIRKTEDMPIDDFGNRADLISSADPIINRMNPSQSWYQWITYVGGFVAKQAQAMPPNDAYAHIRKYIDMINPQFGKYVVDATVKSYECGLEDYLEFSYKYGIHLICPPFLETIVPQLAIDLKNEFDIPLSPVEYNLRTSSGEFIRRVRTRKNVVIGAVYMYLLCKVPKARSSGISNINQLKLPVRQSSASRILSPIRVVPIRTGEDEIRQILMATSPEHTARFMGLYSNSFAGVEAVTEALLTAENPSNIREIPINLEQLDENNRAIGMLRHMGSNLGLDLKNVRITSTHPINKAMMPAEGYVFTVEGWVPVSEVTEKTKVISFDQSEK